MLLSQHYKLMGYINIMNQFYILHYIIYIVLSLSNAYKRIHKLYTIEFLRIENIQNHKFPQIIQILILNIKYFLYKVYNKGKGNINHFFLKSMGSNIIDKFHNYYNQYKHIHMIHIIQYLVIKIHQQNIFLFQISGYKGHKK